jgi:tripartite-type tricarboxylate transporter receptor subunit TctC
VIAGCVAGHTTYAMSPISIAAPYLERGDLVALGVSTARRSSLLPQVPPLAQAGVPGYDFPFWYGVWAASRTPAWIVEELAQDIATAVARPELVDWLIRHDATTMTMTRTQFAAFVVAESEMAARLISSA